MKKIVFTLVFGALICGSLAAQKAPKFTVELSADSILMGNHFMVRFTLENAEGENFEPPSFSEFFIVNGPAVSSSFSMINGEFSRSVTYTYYLEPKDVGNYYIQPASISVGADIIETQPVEIMVVPNPDGIKVQPEQRESKEWRFDSFGDFPFPRPHSQEEPKETPKPKRKTYKL